MSLPKPIIPFPATGGNRLAFSISSLWLRHEGPRCGSVVRIKFLKNISRLQTRWPEEILDINHKFRKRGRSNGFASTLGNRNRVAGTLRFAMSVNSIIIDVDDPDFCYCVPGIDRQFYMPILLQRGIRNLDQEQNIF